VDYNGVRANRWSFAVKSNKWKLERVDVATYGGVLIWLILLETHLLSRPITFLLGPLIIVILFYLLVPSVSADRWRSVLVAAAVASVLGYVLTRYIFTHT
jgi:ABC-type enterobactin transport system permease subunit